MSLELEKISFNIKIAHFQPVAYLGGHRAMPPFGPYGIKKYAIYMGVGRKFSRQKSVSTVNEKNTEN